jgi:hypothetical protein
MLHTGTQNDNICVLWPEKRLLWAPLLLPLGSDLSRSAEAYRWRWDGCVVCRRGILMRLHANCMTVNVSRCNDITKLCVPSPLSVTLWDTLSASRDTSEVSGEEQAANLTFQMLVSYEHSLTFLLFLYFPEVVLNSHVTDSSKKLNLKLRGLCPRANYTD